MRRPLTTLLVLATLLAGSVEVRSDALMVDHPEVDLTPQTTWGYRRGKRVKVKLISIGYETMEQKTGKAFLAMREAALADGIDLYVYSGFRSMEHQRWLYQAWREGYGNKAARPGYSNHQLGRALDIYIGDPGILDWLEANARAHGFKRTVPGEPWHWEYVGKPKKKKAKKKAKTAS